MPRSIKITGIAPAYVGGQPEPVRRQYWQFVAEIALRVKDDELAAGLDARGQPLRAISARTRKYRRSAMTASGKGDPSAPPLMPARQKSRVRSLLAARAFPTHAELYWRYDPFSFDSFAVILTYQKQAGRDVFGISPRGMRTVQQKALKQWEQWKKAGAAPRVRRRAFPAPALKAGPQPRIARIIAQSAEPRARPVAVPTVGVTETKWITRGIEAPTVKELKAPGVQRSGGLTRAEWRRYWTEEEGPSKPPKPPKPTAPKPKPPRPAAAVKPAAPKPAAAGPPAPPAAPPPIQPVLPGRPIAERLKAYTRGDEKVKAVGALLGDAFERAGAKAAAEQELESYLLFLNPGDRRKKAVREKIKELEAALAKATERHYKGQDYLRQEVLEICKPPRPQGWVVDIPPGLEAHTLQAIEKGRDFVAGLVNDMSGGAQSIWIRVKVEPGRALGGNTDIKVDPSGPAKTVAHEIGHCLEDHLNLNNVEKQFIAHRAPGEQPKKFKDLFPQSGYKDDEEGVEDEFWKFWGKDGSAARYCGKYYPNRSEILSMGLEALYNDPVGFARKDPEYCKLILGILDGSLR